ncbi:MAG: NAD(P)H-binding protein [Nodosilinea sp.]
MTSASGLQGSSIAQRLSEAGYRVRGLTRNAAQRSQIEATGAQPIVVDFTDLTSLVQAFKQAEAVVFTAPIDHRSGVREQLSAQIAEAVEKAQVNRIVFNSAADIFEDYDRPTSQVLRAMRDRLCSSNASVITLQPTVYMNNLTAPWAAPAIVNEGVFAYPIESNWLISWISHQTLADFALAAVRYETAGNHHFLIGGPEPLTADTISTILSDTLGKSIRHVPIDRSDFAAGLNQAYGAPAGDDIADFYRYLENHSQALVRDGSAATALGVTPESFLDWATRQDWTQLGQMS